MMRQLIFLVCAGIASGEVKVGDTLGDIVESAAVVNSTTPPVHASFLEGTRVATMLYQNDADVRYEVENAVAVRREALAGTPAQYIFAMNAPVNGKIAYLLAVDEEGRWMESKIIAFGFNETLRKVGSFRHGTYRGLFANFEPDQVLYFWDQAQGGFEDVSLKNYRVIQNFQLVTASPTSSPTGAPTDAEQYYDYIGCYRDNAHRDMKFLQGSYVPKTCRAACSDYKYFGLQHGYCGCGNAYGTTKYYAKMPDSECQYSCPSRGIDPAPITGDQRQNCGHDWRNAIFSTSKIYDPIPDPTVTLAPTASPGASSRRVCSHVICKKSEGGIIQVHHHHLEMYGHKHICQWEMHHKGACGCECYGEDAGMSLLDDILSPAATPAVTPSPTPALTFGATHFKYIGCYSDDGHRDFKEGPVAPGYTSITCRAACTEYKYFALQAGGYCYCGDAYGTASAYVQKPDSECGGPCPGGQADDRCGRDWRNAIYSTEESSAPTAAPTPAPTFAYVGCFSDDGHRDLATMTPGLGYTSTTCRSHCAGYKYFALQAGGHCACGNAYSTASNYVQKPDSECGGPCAGQTEGRCGGSWRNAIYVTGW